MLSVLTGLNGSGKSQLLKALAIHYGDTQLRDQARGTDIVFNAEGEAYKSHEVVFIEDVARPLGRVTASFSQLERQIQNYRGGSSSGDLYENQIAQAFKKPESDIDSSNAFQLLYNNPRITERAVSYHFIAYMQNCGMALYRSQKQGIQVDLEAEFGIPPWDELNESFAAANFDYRVVEPDQIDVTAPFTLTLQHTQTGERIHPDDLSSGEATIVRFLFLIFSASRQYYCPRLMLLDEPDSHLHPSLVHSFMKLLQDIVWRYKCRMIISTHRVETVAFAPDNAVFVMQRQAPRIHQYQGKRNTVGILTGNLYGLVLAGKRPVFVEAQDDEQFYSCALNILLKSGDWPNPVKPEYVAIAKFVKGSNLGGRSTVEEAVRIVSEAGLEGNVFGLVDRDDGSLSTRPGVFVVERYAIENYLLDPLVIYAVMMGRKAAPDVGLSEKLAVTEEHKVRALEPVELKKNSRVRPVNVRKEAARNRDRAMGQGPSPSEIHEREGDMHTGVASQSQRA